ncbi:MAG: hypothetical protein L3J46_11095 [Kangiellaceae bacterium]|nr:hypothetical protein [Kangiellaceae bacterium]
MKNSLKQILKDLPQSIKAEVAEEALDHEDPQTFFKDLLQYGCISGMVTNLIYYKDTHAFYDKHYTEIEALREEYEESIGEPLKIPNDLKNFLAWFAFEQVAYQLVSEIEPELV